MVLHIPNLLPPFPPQHFLYHYIIQKVQHRKKASATLYELKVSRSVNIRGSMPVVKHTNITPLIPQRKHST